MTVVYDSERPAKPRRYRLEWTIPAQRSVVNLKIVGFRTYGVARVVAFFIWFNNPDSAIRIIDQAV